MTAAYKVVLSDSPKMAQLFVQDQLFAEIKNELANATLVIHPRKDGKPWEISYFLGVCGLEDAKRQLYYSHLPPA